MLMIHDIVYKALISLFMCGDVLYCLINLEHDWSKNRKCFVADVFSVIRPSADHEATLPLLMMPSFAGLQHPVVQRDKQHVGSPQSSLYS